MDSSKQLLYYRIENIDANHFTTLLRRLNMLYLYGYRPVRYNVIIERVFHTLIRTSSIILSYCKSSILNRLVVFSRLPGRSGVLAFIHRLFSGVTPS